MFIQFILGKLADDALFTRQIERWRSELKPGATGYLGSTGGVTADGRAVVLARFASAEAARGNSARPEQGAWWSETAKAFDGEPTFHDCPEVDLVGAGGSDAAGFVQVVLGRARDKDAFRRWAGELEGRLREVRPEAVGAVTAWYGDRDFVEAIYFTTEADARQKEREPAGAEVAQEFARLLDGTPEFLDLPHPDLD